MREKLRGCPTCGGDVPVGLRNYSWMDGALPGRVGAADIDAVLEQHATGRVLMMEFKQPGDAIPVGQRLLLQRMVGAGFDVWVVWEYSDHVQVGAMTREGQVPFVDDLTLPEFKKRLGAWWQAGFDRV